MTRFDVAVVGGGMMGAPCARHLAEAGHRVALIAAPEPAVPAESHGPFGSHFDAARITRRVASDPDWSLAARRSIARYRDLEARSGLRIFHEVGALMAGPAGGPPAGWTDDVLAIAATLDDPPETLNAAGAGDRLGLALPPGSRAVHERRDAGWIDPRALREAETRLAVAAGATLVAQAAAGRDGTATILADGTRIEAGHLVVATGPHAASDGLLPRVPAMNVWARTIAFARLSEAEGARLAAMPSVIFVPEGWDHDLYVLPPVRYPDGRLYLKIGGQLDGPQIRDAAEMRDWFHGPGDPEVGARLLDQLHRLVPGLAVEATLTGPCAVAWTETGHPYIAPAGDGVTVLCGGNGAAAKSGDELGRIGALVAQGGDPRAEGYAQGFTAVWA